MVGTELQTSPEVVDAEFVVIAPRPQVDWSFWTDDFPALASMVLTAPLGGLLAYVIVHALGLN